MARTDGTAADIRRLRYFVAVCDHGGLSRAAQAIGIAQPALTRQIKLLESELGTELFTRNGRGAQPNEAGAFLLDKARHHLDGLDDAVERLRHDFAVAHPARISIGICPTIVPLFLDQVSEAVRAGGGARDLAVIEAYSGDLDLLLDAGEIDLALTYAPARSGAVKVRPLLSERLVLAARDVPGEPSVSLADIARMKLILPSRIHQLRRIIDGVCASLDLSLEPALELDSLKTVKALVADGSGHFATILPYHSVAADSAEGQFETRMIDEPAMVRTIALVEPLSPRHAVPDGLAERIAARADDIRRTLEAVF